MYFVVSCMGRLTTVFNAYSCATRDRLLAANFGQDSDEDMYTYVTLIKMLGAKYNSINNAVKAQWQIVLGLKMTQSEKVVIFLDKVTIRTLMCTSH